MPSTLAGLLVAIYLLIPGYCYYVVRRRTVPTRPLSTAVEGANLVIVAMVANATTLGLYGISQTVPWIRTHSPDIVEILRETDNYLLESNSRLAYVGAWAWLLIVVASGLAVALAYQLGPIKHLSKPFTKTLSDESVWHRYFLAEQPKNTYVYLQCDLIDGSHTAGKLVWYNTDLEDHPDRELVLSDPITTVGLNGDSWEHNDTLAILPAREIRQILVTYVKVPEPAPGGEDSDRPGLESEPPERAQPNDSSGATAP